VLLRETAATTGDKSKLTVERGHIAQTKLFGELKIQDEPPLVYLVAPLLRFHRSFHTLARLIAPEIEMYRFDLNTDWRAGVRVVRRSRIN